MHDLKEIFSVGGLILDILGVSVLWWDTKRVTEATGAALTDLVGRVGIWQDNPINKSEQDQLRRALAESTKVSFRGFILLVIGFAGQLAGYLI